MNLHCLVTRLSNELAILENLFVFDSITSKMAMTGSFFEDCELVAESMNKD